MSKRKLSLEKLSAIYDTHNSYIEGGRKIHILNEDTGKCLCGYSPFLFNECDLSLFHNDLVEFIAQPDPDKNFCQRCKAIMIWGL